MRGWVQQRGPKTFRLGVELVREENGRPRRQITKTFHGSRRAADSALAQFVTDALAGLYDKSDETVASLVEKWLKSATPSLSPNTLRGYQSKIRTHIIPKIGERRLADLNTRHLDLFYAELGADLAPNTVRGVHAILHAALEQAIAWEMIDKNPAAHTRRIMAEPEEELDLDPAIVLKVLRAAPAETLGGIAYLATITGLREGELCALQWGDLDVAARTLAVRRRVMANGTVRAKTKNAKTRALGLDRRSVARLRLRKIQAERRARACEVALTDRSFIFSEVPDGLTPLRPNVVAQRWYRHRQRFDLDLTFHGLRHFSASVLLDGGAQLGRVSKRLGHTRQSTTADVYAHVMRASDHDLSDDIARKLR